MQLTSLLENEVDGVPVMHLENQLDIRIRQEYADWYVLVPAHTRELVNG
jgi:hypothetical protein